MIEQIFQPGAFGARRHIDGSPESLQKARDAALIWRANTLAIESAFRFGTDFPVGAVAAKGDWIVGKYFASDIRTGQQHAHAEFMAVMDAKIGGFPDPDTVAVSMEPCVPCQGFLAEQKSIKRVVFSTTYQELGERGLVRPREITVFDRKVDPGLPYEVVRIDDPELRKAGLTIFDHVQRDPASGTVRVDTQGLHEALVELNRQA